MVYNVHVLQFKTYEYSGSFDLQEFFNHIKAWFERNGYDVTEKSYAEKKPDPKTHKVTWECDKKVDDYNQYLLKLIFEINNFKEVTQEGKKLVSGELKVTLEFADVKKDYDEKWESSATKRFARAIYDKFVMEEKESELVKKLKEEMDSLFAEMKQYLG